MNWTTYTYKDENDDDINDIALKEGKENMYLTPNLGSGELWWLASPSGRDSDNVCAVNVGNRNLGYGSMNVKRGVCPVVCLKSGVQLDFVE